MSSLNKARWVKANVSNTPPLPGAPTAGTQPETWWAVDSEDEILGSVYSYDGGASWTANLSVQVSGLRQTSGMFISADAAKRRVEHWLARVVVFTNPNTNWVMTVSP